MNKNWNYQVVAVLTLIVSTFFWFLILPSDSQASPFVMVPLTIALAEGIYIFVRGFILYRKYRILAGLPRSLIRSMAMGLVEIHGKALGPHQVASPLTQTPCFYYRVLLKARGRKPDRDGKSTSVTYRDIDEGGVPFYLQDETGKVRVDPKGIECDLRLQAKRVAAGSDLNLRTLMVKTGLAKEPAGPTNQELMAYAHTVIGRAGGSEPHLSGCTFEEYCILPDRWYDLTGTCTENPTPGDVQARNLIVKGEEEKTFLISWRSEANIEAALRNRALLSTFGGGVLIIASVSLILRGLGVV